MQGMVVPLIGVCLLAISEGLAKTIEISIEGTDDGIKSNKQQDYKEAVLDARLKAIEKAGFDINVYMQVENFQEKYSMVEKRAAAFLLPGFNIVDNEYQTDGTYQILLAGKIESAEERIDSKKIIHAKNLLALGKKSEAQNEIEKIIENSREDAEIAEAIYYKVCWDLVEYPHIEYQLYARLKSDYPDSKYIRKLESYFTDKKYYLDLQKKWGGSEFSLTQEKKKEGDFASSSGSMKRRGDYIQMEFPIQAAEGSFIASKRSKHNVKITVEDMKIKQELIEEQSAYKSERHQSHAKGIVKAYVDKEEIGVAYIDERFTGDLRRFTYETELKDSSSGESLSIKVALSIDPVWENGWHTYLVIDAIVHRLDWQDPMEIFRAQYR